MKPQLIEKLLNLKVGSCTGRDIADKIIEDLYFFGICRSWSGCKDSGLCPETWTGATGRGVDSYPFRDLSYRSSCPNKKNR